MFMKVSLKNKKKYILKKMKVSFLLIKKKIQVYSYTKIVKLNR